MGVGLRVGQACSGGAVSTTKVFAWQILWGSANTWKQEVTVLEWVFDYFDQTWGYKVELSFKLMLRVKHKKQAVCVSAKSEPAWLGARLGLRGVSGRRCSPSLDSAFFLRGLHSDTLSPPTQHVLS